MPLTEKGSKKHDPYTGPNPLMRLLLRPNALFALPYDLRRGLYAKLKFRKFRRLQEKRRLQTDDGYTYKPYDDNRCIFVHIPKAAGMSICRSLFGNLAGGHAPLADYQIIFSREEYQGYFKFSFVRNPWDRVFSAYNFLKSGGANEFDRQWAHYIARYETFDDFIRRGLRTPRMRRKLHFLPQGRFLNVPFNPEDSVDFLGYFENIQQDFETIKRRLNLPHNPVLKHVNRTEATQKQDYRDFYTDETREIVRRFYQQDIEQLGYNFDNSSLPQQLRLRDQRSSE